MTNFPMVLAVWFARVSLRKPPTRAITLILPPHCAQTGDGFWGKSNEKPFIMATAHKKAAITPKPATFDPLGKIPAKPVYLGDHAFSDGDPAKAGDWLGENRMGTRLSWRFPQEKRRSRQNRRLSTTLGKFEAEPVYLGDHETIRIGEAIRISKAVRISETRRDGPCRRSERRQEAPTPGFPVSRRSETFWDRLI